LHSEQGLAGRDKWIIKMKSIISITLSPAGETETPSMSGVKDSCLLLVNPPGKAMGRYPGWKARPSFFLIISSILYTIGQTVRFNLPLSGVKGQHNEVEGWPVEPDLGS
jgi:uncharacterized membrane protein